MYVLPGQHGTGTADALMQAAVKLAKDGGYRRCGSASTSTTNAPSGSTAGSDRAGRNQTFLVGQQTHHDYVMLRRL